MQVFGSDRNPFNGLFSMTTWNCFCIGIQYKLTYKTKNVTVHENTGHTASQEDPSLGCGTQMPKYRTYQKTRDSWQP